MLSTTSTCSSAPSCTFADETFSIVREDQARYHLSSSRLPSERLASLALTPTATQKRAVAQLTSVTRLRWSGGGDGAGDIHHGWPAACVSIPPRIKGILQGSSHRARLRGRDLAGDTGCADVLRPKRDIGRDRQ